MSTTPIADYALLSDRHSAALVSRNGSIDCGTDGSSRSVFERAAAFVNAVGLLAEEADPVSRELLGNFPQAFSHIGLVNAAWAISESERRPRSPDGAPDTSSA